MTARRPYDGAWRRIRRQILDRDGHICQIQLPGCRGTANVVDHIVPTNAGGSWWDPSNLRAACSRCNNKRIDRKGSDRWQSGRTQISLVVGPPGVDKAGRARSEMGPDDLLLDYDELAAVLGPSKVAVSAARNAVLAVVRRAEVDAPAAFLVSSNPDAEAFLPHHRVLLIDPGEATAIEVAKDAETLERVRAWYAARSGRASVSAGSSRRWF